MCKTRFDSQGMILNAFLKNHSSKYVKNTRDLPAPFMANAILNFHFLGILHLLSPCKIVIASRRFCPQLMVGFWSRLRCQVQRKAC